jgi:hypothetical protein
VVIDQQRRIACPAPDHLDGPECDPGGCPWRCPGERGFALVTGRWRALQHITVSPGKVGDIARAALVLTHFEYGYIK